LGKRSFTRRGGDGHGVYEEVITLADLPGWILTIAAGWLAVRMCISFVRTVNLIFFFYLISGIALVTALTAEKLKLYLGADFVETALLLNEWGRISAVAFFVAGFNAFIMVAQPPVARFPRVFSAFPLAIIPAHYFSLHAATLKEWITGIYEAGALIIGLAMYLTHLKKSIQYGWIVSGIVLISFSFFVYWFPDSVLVKGDIAWQLFLTAGLIATGTGIERTEHFFKPDYAEIKENE
jgi:hypothetical protein